MVNCCQYATVLKFYECFFLCVYSRPYVDIIKLNYTRNALQSLSCSPRGIGVTLSSVYVKQNE